MSHELSYTTDVNGQRRADFFTVREPAWHREGIVIEHAPSLDEALRIANLDYVVEKRGVTIDGVGAASKMAFVNIRIDRNVELGSVGPQYKVVQNKDAFVATIGPLVDSGLLKLETGGVLRDGADAWLLGQLDLSKFGPDAQSVFSDAGFGGIAPYVMVKVNHSGRRNNEVILTIIRGVCANTIGLIEADIDGGHMVASDNGDYESTNNGRAKAIGVRHVGNATERMQLAAEKLFGNLIERAEIVAQQYRMLKATELTPAQFRSLVLLPSIGAHPSRRRGWNPEARYADSVVERYEEKAKEIVSLWEKGDGHVADHSAWEGYNGLVQAIDHDNELFPVRGGVYRTQGLLYGNLREMKDRTLATVVQYATEIDEAKRLGTRYDVEDLIAETEHRASYTLDKSIN